MKDWIPFEDATYLAEQAFLVVADNNAALLEQTIINVYTGSGGKRSFSGTGLIRNILLVELLEENDDLDLILDFGGEFKYRLNTPEISGGKVFSPNVKSSIQFSPTAPWHQVPESEFNVLIRQLKFL